MRTNSTIILHIFSFLDIKSRESFRQVGKQYYLFSFFHENDIKSIENRRQKNDMENKTERKSSKIAKPFTERRNSLNFCYVSQVIFPQNFQNRLVRFDLSEEEITVIRFPNISNFRIKFVSDNKGYGLFATESQRERKCYQNDAENCVSRQLQANNRHEALTVDDKSKITEKIDIKMKASFCNDSSSGLQNPYFLQSVVGKDQPTFKKGEHICEYIGEIILDEEVCRRRQEAYNLGNANYILEIKEKSNFERNTYYTLNIDATFCGNESRFINHSCDPNCAIELIRNGYAIPRVIFAATRDIYPNEELTLDYWSVETGAEIEIESEEHREVKKRKISATTNLYKRVNCDCASLNCRKYLPGGLHFS